MVDHFALERLPIAQLLFLESGAQAWTAAPDSHQISLYNSVAHVCVVYLCLLEPDHIRRLGIYTIRGGWVLPHSWLYLFLTLGGATFLTT